MTQTSFAFFTAVMRSTATAAICVLALAVPAPAQLDIVEVVSPKGIKAWLVEDPSDPIVSINFAFVGGNVQDPEGKEGVTNLMVSLLDKGAGDVDFDAFQQQFYETGADLRLRDGSDFISGGIRMLAGDTAEPLRLLSLALTEPRFAETEFEREKAIKLTGLRSQESDPDYRGEKALRAALYGDHPLGRSVEEESLQAITPEDVATAHRKLVARSNLIVGVAGAIDQETLGRVLDEVFGNLPERAELAVVNPPELHYGQTVREVYDQPQTSISMVYPGVGATDRDLFAATLMAEILGGDGLSSRLFNELREKRGLTYGAYAGLNADIGWGSLHVGASTGRDRVGEALETTAEVVRGMIEEGPTEKELADAKKYVIGSYALSQLSSTSRISSMLVGLQRLGRSRTYIDERVELFNKVTLDQVKEIAKRLLSTEPTTLLIGPDTQQGG